MTTLSLRGNQRPPGLSPQAPSARELEQVFCLETERSISNDWVARYENRYFQLERHSNYPQRQAKALVCEWEDGRTEVRYQGKARPHREIEAAAAQATDGDPGGGKPSRRSRWKPLADHPWKKPGPAVAAMLRASASATP